MKVTQVDDSQTTPETKMEAFLRMLDGVTPAATGVTACCPAHADTDPSLSVNIGESGLLLVSCFAGCTFADIAEAVGSNLSGTGWEWPAELRISTVGAATARTDHDLDALERYIDKCADTLTDKARAYAVERFGLTDAQIAALRLGWSPNEGNIWDAIGASWTAVERLTVPFVNPVTLKVAGVQARALSDHKVRWTGLSGSGWSQVGLFDPVDADEQAPVIVTEGPSDALTAYATGLTAVAVRGASLAGAGVVDALVSLDRQIVVAGDGDEAGRQFTAELVAELTAHGVHAGALELTRGSDINDWRTECLNAGTTLNEMRARKQAEAEGQPTPTKQDVFTQELHAAVASALTAPLRTPERVAGGVQDVPTATENTTGPLYAIRATAQGAQEPDDFFIGNRLNVEQLIGAVTDLGPLALGPGDNVYHYADGVWNLDGERQVRKRVRRLLQDRRMESHTSNVLAGLKSEEQFLGTENDPEVLNVTNGLLDWRTGELTEHTPTVPSTYQLTQAWNPEATCPKVDEWLTFIACGDADLVSVLWEIIAVSVMSSAPVHRAALFTGSGRNGKSTALRLIEAVVGKKHCSSVTLQELANNRFAAADLFGAVANIGGDLDSSHLNDTSLFKQATGGDTMKAEFKYGQPFTFVNRAQMLFSANELPTVRDSSQGFWARWLIVPFNASFIGKEDTNVEAALHTELEGVLVRAVEALRRLEANEWQFTACAAIEAATEAYRIESDPVAMFADEMLTPDTEAPQLQRSSVYANYRHWSEQTGRKAMAAGRFYRRLEMLDYVTPKPGKTRNYAGFTMTF